MPHFTLALFNLTNAAPTVTKITLQKNDNKTPSFSIAEGEPITARGQLVGTLELDPSHDSLSSVNSLELAYGFAPGHPDGTSVLVQFGAWTSNNQLSPYIGAASAVRGLVTESYVVESTHGVYVGLVVIRFAGS